MSLVVASPVALSDLAVAAPVPLTSFSDEAPISLSSFAVAAPAVLPVLTFTADGQRVWIGEGVPDVVPGASPGDLFLDENTGELYRLT